MRHYKNINNNHFCCWDYTKLCCTKPEVSKGLLFLAAGWRAGRLGWRLAGGLLTAGCRLRYYEKRSQIIIFVVGFIQSTLQDIFIMRFGYTIYM